MNWEVVSATAAVVAVIGGGLGVYVRLAIKSALGEFKAELLETLNGRYLLRREADVIFAELGRRLDAINKPDGAAR